MNTPDWRAYDIYSRALAKLTVDTFLIHTEDADMTQRMTFAVPGRPAYWIIGGLMCGLLGLSLDLVLSGAVAGEAAKWGGFGALIGASVGLIAVANRLFVRH